MRGMKPKSIGIFALSLLLIVGLLQIDAIGHLNAIFHSIAVSIGRIVAWELEVHSPKTQRITLTTGEQEFLNPDNSQSTSSVSATKSVARQRYTGVSADYWEAQVVEESALDFLKMDFNHTSQGTPEDSMDSRARRLLQEMVEPEDPVTDLFPETEWYDEIDLGNYDLGDLLTREDIEVNLNESLNSDVVAPLLDEIKTQIEEKLEGDAFEVMPEE